MDINENIGNNRQFKNSLVGIPTKVLILQLLDALNYQTRLLIDAKT